VRRLRLGQPRIRSLRTRFGLWVGALVLLALAAFGAYVYVDVGRGLRSTLDNSLRVNASLAASTVTVSGDRIVLGESTPQTNSELEVLLAQGDTIRYLDAAGTIIDGFGVLRSLPADPSVLTATRGGKAGFSNTSDPTRDRDYRVYTMPVMATGGVVGFVQAMHDLESVGETLESLLAALLVGGVTITVAAGILGYLLARRALAPIDAITKTARRISGQDLSARLSLSAADDEVGRLASTFDDMLDRLDKSFQRERRFTADASHELRTPLAAMEAILGVVRAEQREPAEYEQALDDLADETARLRTLVEDLLRLARGSGPAAMRLAEVDLSTLIEDVVDALRPLAEERGLTVEHHVDAGLVIQGDSDSLIRLLLNLLENAIKFTEQGAIVVSASPQSGSVVIDVTDTGIGIAPSDLASIFEPFHRADRARSTPGAGLGLSLARQIAQNHGGTLEVRSREGEGSTFTVTLPSSEPHITPLV
jgi:heavy metal sensor kinase